MGEGGREVYIGLAYVLAGNAASLATSYIRMFVIHHAAGVSYVKRIVNGLLILMLLPAPAATLLVCGTVNKVREHIVYCLYEGERK
ncbi:MAG: hypothetical protein DDT32_00378 [Syntrophomonadaceae bacterium]|nr:hypothetical protein [Bacillota bacterium]